MLSVKMAAILCRGDRLMVFYLFFSNLFAVFQVLVYFLPISLYYIAKQSILRQSDIDSQISWVYFMIQNYQLIVAWERSL